MEMRKEGRYFSDTEQDFQLPLASSSKDMSRVRQRQTPHVKGSQQAETPWRKTKCATALCCQHEAGAPSHLLTLLRNLSGSGNFFAATLTHKASDREVSSGYRSTPVLCTITLPHAGPSIRVMSQQESHAASATASHAVDCAPPSPILHGSMPPCFFPDLCAPPTRGEAARGLCRELPHLRHGGRHAQREARAEKLFSKELLNVYPSAGSV